MMRIARRSVLSLLGVGVATAWGQRGDFQQPAAVPEPVRNLKPLPPGPPPISDDERRARLEKARELMAANKIGAIILEPGPSMTYYTAIRWGLSERTFAMVLPAKGEPVYVVPGFEEGRAREQIRFGNDIRVWQEDESPYRRIVEALRDRGVTAGRAGIEEKTRFFVFDGIRRESRGLEFVSADPVTAGCRMIKSPAEIALLQRANDITVEAFRATFQTLREGMSANELQANLSAAYRALGASGSGLILLGKYTSFPHGTVQPQRLNQGDFVLIDGGCTVEGYNADVTRTVIFGKPSEKQRQVWALERKAQDAAFAAAHPGVPCEAVDAAARRVITDAGFGPDYKLPGLPHRTGHGIGLEGHEWTNLVRGNKTLMKPGMCFSDEPMIVIPGEFGIRLEDCMHINEDGAKLFSKQAPAIDQPFV
jgi:Xaa-Pro dipeptidase